MIEVGTFCFFFVHEFFDAAFPFDNTHAVGDSLSNDVEQVTSVALQF